MTIKSSMNDTGLKTIRGQLQRLRNEADYTASEIRKQAAKELLVEIKRTAPKDTGNFAKSFRMIHKKTRTIITPHKKYHKLFTWLEFTGTKPHEILPRRARVLHWVDKQTGLHHFRYRVWHPGTRATPFVRPAMRRILPKSMRGSLSGLTARHPWIKR